VYIPTVVERTASGERAFDLFSRLLNERIVFLGSPVTPDSANLIVAQLVHLDAEDPDRDIALYLNTRGGDACSGQAIYDAMRAIRPDVQTICFGIAMSMGATLLAGGAPGKRMALPNARVMIHQGHTPGFEGQATDVEIRAREIIEQQRRLEEGLAADTGQPIERVHADMDRDNFMSTDEALAYGIIDRLVSVRELAKPRTAGFRE